MSVRPGLGLLLAFSLAPSCSAGAPTSSRSESVQTLTGRVVGVHDVDTITVLGGEKTEHKIRLKSIDAPELGQAFGQASKQNLSSLVFGKTVTVEWSKRDRYQRIIGRVLLDDADICLEQVKDGYAWHYKEYQREQSPAERESYDKAEDEARTERRGLWGAPAPIQPWEYRKLRKKAAP